MLSDKIKEVFPDVSLPSEYHIEIITARNYKGKYALNKTKKCITIYLNSLDQKEKKRLKNFVLNSFDKDWVELIESGRSDDLLSKLYKYENSKDNQILTFFKPPILSDKDWSALRDSLFLREEFKQLHPIKNLKDDIRSRYGERGNTISNLCTAGYFENPMMDLFNLNTSHTEFLQYWDIAVEKACTALFVNKSMGITEISSEVERRLRSAKDYGQQYIHIHGIGKANIKKINECITKEESKLLLQS